jgi:hypothetical protein
MSMNVKQEESEHDLQAKKFLDSTRTAFSANMIGHRKYFPDDEDARDVYRITLRRGERSWIFEFGQSIDGSGEYVSANREFRFSSTEALKYLKQHSNFRGTKIGPEALRRGLIYKNSKFAAPSAYDVLVSITKNDPGTLEQFCGDFGYDVDSRKAEKTYNAVCEEFKQVQILFNDKEIHDLQEIM